MTNIFKDSYSFIQKRWGDIILVLLFLFIGLIYIVLNDVKLNKQTDSTQQTTNVIIIEGMNNKPEESVTEISATGTSATVIVDTADNTEYVIVDNADKTKDDKSAVHINTDICAKYAGKSHLQQTHCNGLADSVCKVSSCCILAHEKNKDTFTCVAGNTSGSVYDESEAGVPINFDYWYYKNKCYGNSDSCSKALE